MLLLGDGGMPRKAKSSSGNQRNQICAELERHFVGSSRQRAAPERSGRRRVGAAVLPDRWNRRIALKSSRDIAGDAGPATLTSTTRYSSRSGSSNSGGGASRSRRIGAPHVRVGRRAAGRHALAPDTRGRARRSSRKRTLPARADIAGAERPRRRLPGVISPSSSAAGLSSQHPRGGHDRRDWLLPEASRNRGGIAVRAPVIRWLPRPRAQLTTTSM